MSVVPLILKSMATVHDVIDIRRIYAEPEGLACPRGQDIVARWPEATIQVASHWNIPEVHGDERNVQRWCASSARRSCWA